MGAEFRTRLYFTTVFRGNDFKEKLIMPKAGFFCFFVKGESVVKCTILSGFLGLNPMLAIQKHPANRAEAFHLVDH